MGKVKIKKKSTLIDMTAMSDVTVLLLTFFMLTSTFLEKEPTTVQTPSSVSVEAVPAKDLVTVLVSSEDQTGKFKDPTAVEGRIFISLKGDSMIDSEKLREEVLKNAISIYNDQRKNKLAAPTQAQMNAFKKLTMFGMPFSQLYKVLDMDPTEREKWLSDLNNPQVGIPINDNKDASHNFNDFQIWMQAIKLVAQQTREDKLASLAAEGNTDENAIREADILYNNLMQGRTIAVKADKFTPFKVVHRVFDNLQTMSLNKFTLMTNLKNESGN